MIQVLETIHSGVKYWLVFDKTEIVGKYSTKSEALKIARNKYAGRVIFTT